MNIYFIIWLVVATILIIGLRRRYTRFHKPITWIDAVLAIAWPFYLPLIIVLFILQSKHK